MVRAARCVTLRTSKLSMVKRLSTHGTGEFPMRNLQYKQQIAVSDVTCIPKSHGRGAVLQYKKPRSQCPSFEGLCDGGPKDGQKLVSLFRRVTIPIVVQAPNCIGAGYYKFEPDNKTWIWNGP